jgi:hypothetical protein
LLFFSISYFGGESPKEEGLCFFGLGRASDLAKTRRRRVRPIACFVSGFGTSKTHYHLQFGMRPTQNKELELELEEEEELEGEQE